MALKRELNSELRRLRQVAKELAKERDDLTKSIDAQIQANSDQQKALEDYMSVRFGPTEAPGVAKAKSKPVGRPPGRKGRRVRRDRSDVRPRVLAVINDHPQGIRRRAILKLLDLENDDPGKQYVSNTIKDLRAEGLVSAVGRKYFPTPPSAMSDEASSSESSADATPTAEETVSEADLGSDSESSDAGSASIDPISSSSDSDSSSGSSSF